MWRIFYLKTRRIPRKFNPKRTILRIVRKLFKVSLDVMYHKHAVFILIEMVLFVFSPWDVKLILGMFNSAGCNYA